MPPIFKMEDYREHYGAVAAPLEGRSTSSAAQVLIAEKTAP